MNKMREVANLLGVEIGEEFNIEDAIYNPYVFTEDGLYDCENFPRNGVIGELLCDNRVIEKIPFKPKDYEEYWSPYKYKSSDYSTEKIIWTDYMTDFLRYKCGLVFRTEKEAREIGIPKLKQIIDEFNNET